LSGNELEAIRSAVVTLPKDQRQAIEMAFFGGLTHQEIAETLSEPLGTVKARIRRGMLKLRESLQVYV
jgi:RNA polymerase sigma-70 factor (ECF subfamily)